MTSRWVKVDDGCWEMRVSREGRVLAMVVRESLHDWSWECGYDSGTAPSGSKARDAADAAYRRQLAS